MKYEHWFRWMVAYYGEGKVHRELKMKLKNEKEMGKFEGTFD